MDMNLPKAWAEWGKFNDRIYRDRPETVQGPQPEPEPGKPKLTDEQFQASYARDRAVFASSAVSCYLQAAGLYNNHKSRALLLRVLWLLGLDDSLNTIAKAFENYKGDLVIWYWITLIPQLILSLSHREAKQARLLLMRIAKQYPQALFYQLRVSREDFSLVKRQHMSSRAAAARKAAEQAKAAAAAAAASAPTPASAPANGEAETAGGEAAPDGEVKEDKEVKADAKPDADGDAPRSESTPQPSSSTNANADTNPNASANDNPAPTVNSGTDTNANADANADAKANTSANANANAAAPGQPQPPANTQPPAPRQPWELVDEIMNVLKTAFPLLTLTMEKMVDQISIRAKPASDEDIYRFFAALLADALQVSAAVPIRGWLADEDSNGVTAA
jgi:transformation/transcription domain-associated protein